MSNKKPHLGLMPEWRHKELRLQEVDAAIQRYCEENKAVPINWIVESYTLREWLQNWEENKKVQPVCEECGEIGKHKLSCSKHESLHYREQSKPQQ